MASGSGPGKDQPEREPAAEGSNPNAAPAAFSSEALLAAGVTSRRPRASLRVARSLLRILRRPGGGTSRGTDGAGSSSAAAEAADRKGKKVASPSPSPSSSPPSSDGSVSSAYIVASGADLDPFVAGRYEPAVSENDWGWAARKDNQVTEAPKEEQPQPQPQGKKKLWTKLKGKSLWSGLKNKVFKRKGSLVFRPYVDWQTIPLNEFMDHYYANRVENAIARGVRLIKMELPEAYSEFRPVVADGESFYRSFIFSYLEQVLDRQDTREELRVLSAVERVATLHAQLGLTYTFSTSCKAFEKLIKKVMKWKRERNVVASTNSHRKQKLLEFFNTKDKMQPIFVFLRLVGAVWICSNRDYYEPITSGLRGGYSLQEWCLQYLTPRREMVDQIPMAALTTALEVPLRVERLTAEGSQDIYTGHPSGRRVPRVTLLYNGIHYDILYPRHPSDILMRVQADRTLGETLADKSSSQ